jgi:large subunit ribosomal protein L14e
MEHKMFDVGRVCVKIAGRDAGKKCVVVEVIDDKNVLIDGMTRRRKCNKIHLEPLNQKLDLEKNASHDDVAKAFKQLGLEVRTTKPKQKTEKPKPVARGKVKADTAPKKDKKEKPTKKDKKKE